VVQNRSVCLSANDLITGDNVTRHVIRVKMSESLDPNLGGRWSQMPAIWRLRSQMPLGSAYAQVGLNQAMCRWDVRSPILRRRTQLELWAVSGTHLGSQPRHGRCISAKPPLRKWGP
jgi:hypothetical protein